jgi:xanthine dehydrogenase large subunit
MVSAYRAEEFESSSMPIRRVSARALPVKRVCTHYELGTGINFPKRYLNQAGAHLLVYQDGSVGLTHAATEMGQGVHIKIMQVNVQPCTDCRL